MTFVENAFRASAANPARPRILFVLGTRPEAIKTAPVVLELRAHRNEFETLLCSTGQHHEMLDRALAPFGLEPDIDLKLMTPHQTLTSLTTSALSALDKEINSVRPDLIVVQGDTTSAMVGALAAYYKRIPVAHLEAGLRTSNLFEPFPEEGNRRLISTLSTLHWAPTPRAAQQLLSEGVPEQHILVTGNTVIDALLHVRENVLPAGTAPKPPNGRRRVLLTMHRRESHGPPLESVCRAILELVIRNSDVEVLFPIHPSPFVRGPVTRLLREHPRIELSDPVEYTEFVGLLDSCYFVMTDSGGVQEEAPALGKPVLVLRNATERPEAVEAGTSLVVGTDALRVLKAAETLLHDEEVYRTMAQTESPYGDGRATKRVVEALRFYFGLATERLPVPFVPRPDKERLVGETA